MSERPLFVPVGGPAAAAEPHAAEPEWDERRMTIIEHLEELRRVLIVSLIAWAVGSIAGVVLSGFAIRLLTLPLQALAQVTPEATKLHYLSPMGYFTIHLKVGLVVGLALALPVILWQIWTFVAPGLRPAERRFAGPLLVSSLGLFAAGAALAYLFLYIAVRIIAWVSGGSSDLVFFPEATAYLGFVVILMLSFAIAFEFPVALVLLAAVGILKSEHLARRRRGAYFGIVAAGYVITPGVDLVTPLALIIPLLLLYEASIFVIRRMKR
jgi:sec-independent protein translocase protein TatC